MSESDSLRTSCGSCGDAIDESPSLAVGDRQPCPKCGSTSRRILATVSDTIHIGTSEQAIVQPATFRVKAHLPQGSITVDQRLPTEVIAEVLTIKINALRPHTGKWAVDVSAIGALGQVIVGELDDVATELAIWIRGLAERWEERLRLTDDEPLS